MSEKPGKSTKKRSNSRRIALALVVLVLIGIGFAWQPVSRYWRISHPAVQNLPLPAELWAMDAGKGVALTARNSDDADFKPMRAAFESQIYGTYCGVASAVIALNALGQQGVRQDSFFTAKAEEVRSQQEVFYGGMSLDQLGKLLESHGAKVQVVHARESRVDTFRDEARANVEGGVGSGPEGAGGDMLLVNYLRKAIDQRTGGHVSPVVAYDTETDRFLILDVSTYKYPPVWVKTAALFKAMNTIDSGANLSRGWVHVRLPAVH